MRRIIILVLLVSISLFSFNKKKIDSYFKKQIFIKGGCYFVGGGNEFDNKELKKMYFKSFYIDIHPVTNKQYLVFLNKSGYTPVNKLEKSYLEQNPYLPVTNISYFDAISYCKYYGLELPTEWEWEIVAKSLKKDIIYINKHLPNKKRGNFLLSKIYKVVPILTFPPNDLGVFGMAGNVYEWTRSDYPKKYLKGNYYEKFKLKVLRGGAWTDLSYQVTTTLRVPFPASRSLPWLGFRTIKYVNSK